MLWLIGRDHTTNDALMTSGKERQAPTEGLLPSPPIPGMSRQRLPAATSSAPPPLPRQFSLIAMKPSPP